MSVLCWPKRLLSADDLRRHLSSQRELLLLPNTVITPLAADELRAKGVRISWQVPQAKEAVTSKPGTWSYSQEQPDALVAAAVQALERDGVKLTLHDGKGPRSLAEAILSAKLCGGVAFCSDPALVCCIGNKVAGLRGAAVWSAAQVQRAKKHLGANLFAIEMPGRTLFELRQMLRAIVTDAPNCPETLARTLQELDGHAHR
jgi:hypothetical protein